MLVLTGIDDPKLDSTASHLPRLTACLAVSVIPGTLRRRLWVVRFCMASVRGILSSVGPPFRWRYLEWMPGI